nr:MAG TPA: hypothetical protein [Caudoviricetes sp.]
MILYKNEKRLQFYYSLDVMCYQKFPKGKTKLYLHRYYSLNR